MGISSSVTESRHPRGSQGINPITTVMVPIHHATLSSTAPRHVTPTDARDRLRDLLRDHPACQRVRLALALGDLD
jgi:hypothetical protein